MGQAMKPKLSVYLSDHVAKRLTQAASRPGTNKSAIVDTALDRFLNPERDIPRAERAADGICYGSAPFTTAQKSELGRPRSSVVGRSDEGARHELLVRRSLDLFDTAAVFSLSLGAH
jgi:hypothetical protein